ncbi:MAG TPA: pentapeptide repeat-containing protein [Ktedonobacteraceae bacterium]|nr:pentapeptide repeat-containing protein [Ktedonobacteraceae bacterium]
MANPEHLAILKQGVEAWNQWRQEHPEIEPDLSEADLRKAFLNIVNFRRTKLWKTDLSDTFLIEADLRETDLRETRFQDDITPILTGASLIGANLSKADLTGADLSHTNIIRADLSEAILDKARFFKQLIPETTLIGASLRGVDLSEVDLSKKDLSRVDFTGANLKQVNLTDSILQGANLTNVNLNGATLLRTNLENATLNGCSIYGISAWDLRLEGAKQNSLIITPDREPTITVDNLEVAQFIYLLLNHKKLRDVFNTMTERGVLILGRFGGGGLEVLQAIAARLREVKYLPIIFDFARPYDRTFTETVQTLAGLSRFIIADLSGPSVPQELYATVPHFKIPFVPIIEAGRKPFAMSLDLLEYPWVVRPSVTFATTEELLEQLPTKVIAPAEEKHQARQKLLDELFNKA